MKTLNLSLIAGIAEYLNRLVEDLNDVLFYTYQVRVELLMSIIGDAGFDFIGAGADRAVFTHPMVPDVVFKVAYSGEDYMAESEHSFYNRVSEETRQHLAECYCAYGAVSVMEQVHGMLAANTGYGRDYETRFSTECTRRGRYESYVELEDAHHKNLMITEDGRIILIDYAYN